MGYLFLKSNFDYIRCFIVILLLDLTQLILTASRSINNLTLRSSSIYF